MKFVFITWVGENAPAMKKGAVTGHKASVGELFKVCVSPRRLCGSAQQLVRLCGWLLWVHPHAVWYMMSMRSPSQWHFPVEWRRPAAVVLGGPVATRGKRDG